MLSLLWNEFKVSGAGPAAGEAMCAYAMCTYGHQGGDGEETLGARQPFAGAIIPKATFRVAYCVLGTLIHIAWHIVGRKCKLMLIYMLHLFIFVTLTL